MRANLTATLEGFRTDQAKLRETMVNWKTDMAQRDAEAAKRDKDNLRWTTLLVLGCTAPVIGAVALFS